MLKKYLNKKILVVGLGKSGYSAARLLVNKGFNVYIKINTKNLNNTEYNKYLYLLKLGVKEYKKNDLISEYSLIIKNPGLSYDKPIILNAKENNIPIITEPQVALDFYKGKVIAITGSNGKTTTATLIFNLLKSKYKKVHLVGNIGSAFCNIASNSSKNDIAVLELSSFQLMGMRDFKTDISIITNITNSHLDFHQNKEEYKEAKINILWDNKKQKSRTKLNILNYDDPFLSSIFTNEKNLYFSLKNSSIIGSYIKNNKIYYNNEYILNTNFIRLPGEHNLSNILCAINVAKYMKINNNQIKQIVYSFKGINHRLENLGKIKDRIFINDSKSTNVVSTINAIKSINKKVILILGGKNIYNYSLDGLEELTYKIKTIFIYGENKEKIKKFAKFNNINFYIHNNLQEVIKNCFKKSNVGDIILFSPASQSYDQFTNFEQRGNVFKTLVKEYERL